MSWTQLMAAWGMDIGLSAPVAGTLGVVAGVLGPVVVISLVMGGLEAWAASMRRTSGAAGGARDGSEDQKQPAQRRGMSKSVGA